MIYWLMIAALIIPLLAFVIWFSRTIAKNDDYMDRRVEFTAHEIREALIEIREATQESNAKYGEILDYLKIMPTYMENLESKTNEVKALIHQWQLYRVDSDVEQSPYDPDKSTDWYGKKNQ